MSQFRRLYSTQLVNLNQMDNFLDRDHLQKLRYTYQNQVNYINSTITSKEIEAAIKSLLTKKKSRARWFQCRILPDFQRRDNTDTPQTIAQNRTEGKLPNSFYEATVTLIPKPHKDSTKKENFRLISLINIDGKILNKVLEN